MIAMIDTFEEGENKWSDYLLRLISCSPFLNRDEKYEKRARRHRQEVQLRGHLCQKDAASYA